MQLPLKPTDCYCTAGTAPLPPLMSPLYITRTNDLPVTVVDVLGSREITEDDDMPSIPLGTDNSFCLVTSGYQIGAFRCWCVVSLANFCTNTNYSPQEASKPSYWWTQQQHTQVL
ncbi:hypothetical protein PHLCEN_2v3349 [Hermanssonia centrifuga]|uniref:Uncharacterized protein n=1 Tax=Hermanssonia centrifuga TaxID=98765 RepID=A0A2R6QM47_9APHY|nr:hypothetical protein PHLCEN_2v3349 [Hermanssonia centrifuga]